MKKDLRVSLSGTHCTGKTTLLEEIRKDEFFRNHNYVILDGPTRQLKDQGFPINNDDKQKYDNTQLMCSYIDATNLTTWKGKVISDRCLLDTYIYTKYLYENRLVSRPTFLAISSFWECAAEKYDLIILPSPKDVELVGDKYRNEDKKFRDRIWKLFQEELELSRVKYHIIEGTTKQRMDKLKFHLINQS